MRSDGEFHCNELTMYHGYVSWLCLMAMYHGYVSWRCIMAMYHGYVPWLCIMAMYHGYVSRLCITAMYHGYVSWLCLLSINISKLQSKFRTVPVNKTGDRLEFNKLGKSSCGEYLFDGSKVTFVHSN